MELKDIMAPITVIFKQRVANLIAMGDKGTVLYVIKNETLEDGDYRITEYPSAVFELTPEFHTNAEQIEKDIKNIFGDGVNKVILAEYKTAFADLSNVIKTELKWDWMFSTEQEAQEDVAALAKELEKFAFVYNNKADSMYVVSINNPSAILADGNDTKITAEQIMPYVIGVIAGCPYDKSISYKIFSKLKTVELPSMIEEGFLTLYNEEEGVRVASPVNTLTTTGENQTEDMKSITIVEGMKRMKADLEYAFRTGYKGKYKNKYDNQALYYGAAEFYFSQLEEIGVLDPEYDNKIGVDIEATRALWTAQGKDAQNWDEVTVKKTTYKNMVIALADVKFLDAMEGMQITVEMF